MKALVMEVSAKEMVIMTSDGRFLSRPLLPQKPEVGAEVDFTEQPVAKVNRAMIFWTAAAVFFFSLLAGSWWWEVPVTPVLGNAVSFVTIDINPSVELGIDDQDQVVSWEGLNSDGEKLLAGRDFSGQKSADVVAALVGLAADDGYLAPEKNNEVIINLSQDGAENAASESIKRQLADSAQTALRKRNLVANVSSLQTSLALRQEAREIGISAAKYAILLEAESIDLPIDLDQVKTVGIIKAIKAAGGNPGQIVSMAQQEKKFARKIEQWKEKRARLQAEQETNSDGSEKDQPEAAIKADKKVDIENNQNNRDPENSTAQNDQKMKSKQEIKADQLIKNGQENNQTDKSVIKNTLDGEKKRISNDPQKVARKQRALLWLKDKIKAEFRQQRNLEN